MNNGNGTRAPTKNQESGITIQESGITNQESGIRNVRNHTGTIATLPANHWSLKPGNRCDKCAWISCAYSCTTTAIKGHKITTRTTTLGFIDGNSESNRDNERSFLIAPTIREIVTKFADYFHIFIATLG